MTETPDYHAPQISTPRSAEDTRNGRRFFVPASRRLTTDLLYFHRTTALCGHSQRMDLEAVAKARSDAPRRISWSAVFIKAYGLLSQRTPELRQLWCRFPWSHVYQHPHSVAIVAVSRQYKREPWLFWGPIQAPERKPLSDIQTMLTRFTTEDPRTVFRQQTQLSSLPTLPRRAVWWWNLNIGAARRARRLGTFFVSSLAGKGVEIDQSPTIQTGVLNYGPSDDRHSCCVRLSYDHRLMDGLLIADALNDLEAILNEEIADELRSLSAGTDQLHPQAA